ncbi:ABC transporter permease subunit [Thermaerobacter litoralis]
MTERRGFAGLGRFHRVLVPTALNPILELEFRARMRRNRTVLLLLGYTGAVAALFLLAVVLSGVTDPARAGAAAYEITWIIFQVLMLAELVLIGAVAGATGAGSISGERERQTWEVLLVTKLPAWRMVTGKLLAAVALALWLVVASLPVFLPLFRFNAVQPDALVRLLIHFTVSALAWAALGLFFSTVLRRTVAAVIATYGVAMAWVAFTLLARPVLDALNPPGPQAGAVSPRPLGPLAVELASPVLSLLYALRSPVIEAWNWIAGAIVLGRGSLPPPGVRLTTAARVAGLLGPDGYFWAYVLWTLAFTVLLVVATTRLITRRRA